MQIKEALEAATQGFDLVGKIALVIKNHIKRNEKRKIIEGIINGDDMFSEGADISPYLLMRITNKMKMVQIREKLENGEKFLISDFLSNMYQMYHVRSTIIVSLDNIINNSNDRDTLVKSYSDLYAHLSNLDRLIGFLYATISNYDGVVEIRERAKFHMEMAWSKSYIDNFLRQFPTKMPRYNEFELDEESHKILISAENRPFLIELRSSMIESIKILDQQFE